MEMQIAYKLGSLFDGSGGFPLAGSLCGINPVWAAEVEPYPIAVTRSRFPNMKHLGSVTYIHGGEIEPVDVITFGSPCQDLSIAGKRAGLKHEYNGDDETTRSGLFMEAVRIIKEMREATNGRYPTFALWENVPGAFSSNKGEDLRTVLEELVRIIEPNASVPPVPKAGWPYADSYRGDGWSLAYRVFDAQYWGVPQRRRRIYLVLDLRGERAREVLFEREGVRGYFSKSRTPWQGTAAHPQRGPAPDDRDEESNCVTPWDVQSRRIYTPAWPWPSLYSGEGGGHGYVITDARGEGRGIADVVPCDGGGNGALMMELYEPCSMRDENWAEQKSKNAIRANASKSSHAVVEKHLFENHSNDTRYKGPLDVCPMLPAQLGTGGNNTPFIVEDDTIRYTVRRLTPTECARLQGFPYYWGRPDHKESFTDEELTFWQGVRDAYAEINGKQVKAYTSQQMLKWYNGLHTDSAEYKMLGNGIALPTALYCMQGISDALRIGGDRTCLQS